MLKSGRITALLLAVALMSVSCGSPTSTTGGVPSPALTPTSQAAADCESGADVCALPGSVSLGTQPGCGSASGVDQLGQVPADTGLGHTLNTPDANPVSGITSVPAQNDTGNAGSLGISGSIGTAGSSQSC